MPGVKNIKEIVMTVGGDAYNDPDLIDQKSYSLNASTKGYDLKDLAYGTSGSTSPKPFAWDIAVLKPGEEWGTGYSIKPTEANLDGWTIPAAPSTFTVNNKPYSSSTSTITLIVNVPRLLLNKTVSKPVVNISEDVTVTVSVNNIGNIGTKTDVKSSDRPIIKVIGPSKPTPTPARSASQTQVGNPSSSQGNPGASSQTPRAASTSTSEPTPTPITPCFDIAFAVLVLIFAAGFERK